jgi:hypothetical protein
MQLKSTIVLILFTVFFTANMSTQAQQQNKPSAAELQADMRKLWEDHITWTRNVIFNFIDELPGTTEAVTRLLQNQDDIGNAIKPFYGEAAGNQLATLLREHITTAAALLTALDDGDINGLNEALEDWYANADAIAAFLSGANPNWPLAEMKAMMREHLDLTTQEAVARKQGNYAADVAAYDAIHLQILEMADMLTGGIVKQFPHMFTRGCPPGNTQMTHETMSMATLEQNAPNPFSATTVIGYYVPETVKQAELVIYNDRGIVVKRLNLPARGTGSVTLYTSGLQKGVYTYSIIADGHLADTKKLINR